MGAAGTIGGVDSIRFDDHGLVPCVMQDAGTGEVLTLAYMNEEALARTRETGEMHFWSRSRARAVAQGRDLRQHDARAGAALRLRRGRAAGAGRPGRARRATPASAPASTAARSTPQAAEALPALERTIAERAAAADPGTSYTAELLADAPRIGEKVREEADEAARAAAGESDERLAEEAADVLYHLSVLMASRGLSLATPSTS